MNAAPQADLSIVEWRVDGKPGRDERCRFVPYLDARDIASMLDEWVGPENWQDVYVDAQVGGQEAMWCHLSIRVDDEWVTKRDVGVAGNFQKAKSLVSDSFKRAGCLKWGVGRNVYDLPTLRAPCRVDEKGNAWPTDATLPNILDQLRRLGFNAEGGRVAAGEPESEPSAPAEAPAEGDPAACGRCGDPLAGQKVKRVDGVNYHADCVEGS